ncbi:hypothetical protein Q7A53_06135 [Halobacillus rhizosphaerae]|uniref:hypothetical protein n=1 Tax=Halobacillus rhizosphaerae TaxID=3064889 RepID=UPI00398B183E
MKKILEFQASISDVKTISPLFSTCKVRVLYTGKNRNYSSISKEAVQNALPTIINIPIVGEYSVEAKDYKGHGGAIDLDSYDFIHTTKPYGVVPESAEYEWEEVRGSDGSIREYLTVSGCILWTGRYAEANDVIKSGKGQSMEIEVTDGTWNDDEETYEINNFVFSAFCILGDEVEPAFEDANITATYTLDKNSFKQEFSQLLGELQSYQKNKEENDMFLKQLLEKYSLTVEQLNEKGIKFDEISEDQLEAKIIEVFELEVKPEVVEPKTEPVSTEPKTEPEVVKPEATEPVSTEPEVTEPTVEDLQAQIATLETANSTLTSEKQALTTEVETLRQFKLDVEKTNHEAKVQDMFTKFQLTEEDVKEIDIHSFTLEQLEDKCFSILGRKMASKNFSKENDSNIRLTITSGEDKEEQNQRYGDLFDKYNK